MEALNNLIEGFKVLFAAGPLIALFVGTFVGSLVGVLPGVGPVGAMAVLLPITFTLDPTTGIIMLIGIFFGSMYGGSTTSILMRVPGEATSVIVSIEGHEMTKKGRAGAALTVAAIGSFIAGTLAVVALTLLAQPLSDFAIQFSAPEFLALTVFAVFVLSRLSGGTYAEAMVAVGLGLMLATIGLDQASGNTRFTFGLFTLTQGVNITALAVGLFGIAEVLLLAEQRGTVSDLPTVRLRNLLPTKQEFRRAVPPMFRGGVLGFFLGLIPGPAAVTATYASYALERSISSHKDQFGKGAVEGVSGPEAANNGASGGGMIPVLILGIPFTAPTALLLAGFIIQGVIPGPLLMDNNPDLFWGVIAGMYAANIMLLILNLPLVGIFTTMLRVPRDIMLAAIIMLAIVGTYATRNSMFDVIVLIAMGVLGYAMAKVGLSRVALILPFVIAGIMEQSLTQTLRLARGDLVTYMFGRPIALTILIATALAVFGPLIFNKFIGDSELAAGLRKQLSRSDEE